VAILRFQNGSSLPRWSASDIARCRFQALQIVRQSPHLNRRALAASSDGSMRYTWLTSDTTVIRFESSKVTRMSPNLCHTGPVPPPECFFTSALVGFGHYTLSISGATKCQIVFGFESASSHFVFSSFVSLLGRFRTFQKRFEYSKCPRTFQHLYRS